MITLESAQFNGEDFLVDAKMYPSMPSKSEQDYIRYYEKEIINRTNYFLSDPQFFISEWEKLTDAEMPERYTKEFPEEIVGTLIGGKGKGVEGVVLSFLPILTESGETINYKEESLVSNFLSMNRKVYILKESVLKQLATA